MYIYFSKYNFTKHIDTFYHHFSFLQISSPLFSELDIPPSPNHLFPGTNPFTARTLILKACITPRNLPQPICIAHAYKVLILMRNEKTFQRKKRKKKPAPFVVLRKGVQEMGELINCGVGDTVSPQITEDRKVHDMKAAQ